MAENTIDLKVNNSQALTALKQVETEVTKLSTAFTKLRTVLAGLTISNLITNSLELATSIQNVATATGISTQTISEFTSVLIANGSSAKEAATRILEFSGRLGEAKMGSAGIQAALSQVGITLSDLAKLSEQELFVKTVQNLSKIEDSSKRNRLSVQLLGEELKKVDVRNVAAALGTGAGANAASIKAAADAQRNLSTQFNNLQQAIINILEPLNKLVAQINISAKEFEKLILIITMVTTVLLTITYAGRVWTAFVAIVRILITLLSSLVTATINIAQTIRTLIVHWKSFLENIKQANSILRGTITTLQVLFEYLGTKLAPLLEALKPLWIPFAAIATAAIGSIIESFDNLFEKGKKVIEFLTFGLVKFNNVGADQTDAETARLKRLEEQTTKQKEANQKIIDAQRGQALEAQKIVNAYKLANAENIRNLGLQNEILAAIDEQGNLRFRSAEEQEKLTKLFEVDAAYIKQINELQQKYNDMKAAAAAPGTPEEQAAFAAFAKVYGKTIDQITNSYVEQRKQVDKLIDTNQGLKLIEADRQRAIDLMTKKYDDQIARMATLSDIFTQISQKKEDMAFERSLQGKGDFERQLLTRRRELEQFRLELIRIATQSFTVDDMIVDPAGYEAQIKLINDSVDTLKSNLDGLTANSRKFQTGWNEAFENFVDNATNMANVARDIFTSFTNNVENALENMVRTGKLGFKDLVRNIILDLTSIALKQAFRNLFSMINPESGGWFSAIGNFFAGFFAQGGFIPPGKAGIVGENGPELINGPARITPLAAGGAPVNNYYTYNISAIDSRSVAQFFAEHRRTMLGATEQARKEFPIRQRF